MTTTIQIYSSVVPIKTKNEKTKLRENSIISKNNMLPLDTVSFKGSKIEIAKNKTVIKSASNSFFKEVATAWKVLIGLFKLKESAIDFEKMSRKEIKTFLAKRQFRLCFESSYEKYNISGKSINLVTKCKQYPEFAKEIFSMKEKDIFHRFRFYEQDIVDLFMSYETNPELTKELIVATNPDGSATFNANVIRSFVELKDDEFVRDNLKKWGCRGY